MHTTVPDSPASQGRSLPNRPNGRVLQGVLEVQRRPAHGACFASHGRSLQTSVRRGLITRGKQTVHETQLEPPRPLALFRRRVIHLLESLNSFPYQRIVVHPAGEARHPPRGRKQKHEVNRTCRPDQTRPDENERSSRSVVAQQTRGEEGLCPVEYSPSHSGW